MEQIEKLIAVVDKTMGINRTKVGTAYYTERVSTRGGNQWRIISLKEIQPNEIDEIIQSEFPSEGYGMSRHCKPRADTIQGFKAFITEVYSNASCD